MEEKETKVKTTKTTKPKTTKTVKKVEEVKKKFCTSCGKQLVEGSACECQTVKAAPVLASSTSSFDFGTMINETVELVKSLIKKPITTVKEKVETIDQNTTYFLLAIAVIVAGITTTILTEELTMGLMNAFGGYGSMVEFDFMEVFIKLALYNAVVVAGTIFAIYAVAVYVFKKEIALTKSTSLVAITSVLMSVVNLLAIVAIYISFEVLAVVYLVGSVFYSTVLYEGITHVTQVEEDKKPYIYTAILIGLGIVVYIASKLFL